MLLKDELKKLVELQILDADIYKLRREKDTALPELIAGHNNELAVKKQALKTIEDKLKQAQLNKKEKELELAVKEESAKKAQTALYQLKSNKEYQTKLTEISSLKADISLYDEEVLKAIDSIEKIEAEVKIARQTFAAHEQTINATIAKINNDAKELDVKLNILQDKRAVLQKDVDAEILAKYDRLLDKRAGLAITAINGETCNYCHMRVNHQKINEIKMYKELVLCESCIRILYIPEEFET